MPNLNSEASDDQQESSLLTMEQISKKADEYIWNSPCLKPFIYSPFLLSAIIVLIIWAIDLYYKKEFCDNGINVVIQHMAFTYVIVACGMTMNHMLVKYKYKKNKVVEEPKKVSEPNVLATYVEEPNYVSTYSTLNNPSSSEINGSFT